MQDVGTKGFVEYNYLLFMFITHQMFCIETFDTIINKYCNILDQNYSFVN
jgi:hypothetical protein